MDYHGLLWISMSYFLKVHQIFNVLRSFEPGAPWNIMDYLGLALINMDYCLKVQQILSVLRSFELGAPMDYHGLS